MISHRYWIYGLLVDSTQPLKGVLSGRSNSTPDLRIVWRHDTPGSLEDVIWTPVFGPRRNGSTGVSACHSFAGDQESWRLRLEIDGAFSDFIFNKSTRTLHVIYPVEIARGRLVSYLMGTVMSSILRLTGTLCLHASVVVINGRAIALAGRKGAGKSTISAALAQRGATILSDDIAAITLSGDQYFVHPGDARSRLLPNSVQKLFGANNSFRKAITVDDKIRVTMNPEFVGSPAGDPYAALLTGFCLLEPSGAPTTDVIVSVLRPGENFMAISEHLYGFWLDKQLTQANEFKMLGQIVDRTQIFKLVRPDGLENLDLTCDVLMAEFGRIEETDFAK